MPPKLSSKQEQEIESLYALELPLKEIARRTGVSYSAVYGRTKLRERGFSSMHKYQEHRAQQRGFSSWHKYQEHLAKQRGFNHIHKYQEHLAQQKGFSSWYKYQEDIAQQRGFSSWHKRKEDMAQQRQQRLLNQGLSDLIRTGLEELGENQAWLANKLGVTGETVTGYLQGKYLPRKEKRLKLEALLGIDFQSLEKLVEEK